MPSWGYQEFLVTPSNPLLGLLGFHSNPQQSPLGDTGAGTGEYLAVLGSTWLGRLVGPGPLGGSRVA